MKDKTLYVVSGFMRTGTSMMMKALEAGGMKAIYQQSRDVMKNRFADKHYDPNVGGLYELERKDYMIEGFPKGYEGKLIKSLNMEYQRPLGVVKSFNIMPEGIRVVFMKRDAEEIRQSYNAFFGKQLRPQIIKTMSDRTKICVERIKNRKDVLSCDVFGYRDVIKTPLGYFKILKRHGWPINPKKCVKIVDSKYIRYKVEKLTKGVE